MFFQSLLAKLKKREDVEETQIQKKMSKGRIIVFTSGKGGVGKTTCSATIGSFLAMSKHKVLLIDMDTGLRNLDLVLGVNSKVNFNLYDILERNVNWQRGIIRTEVNDLFVLVTDHTREKQSIDREKFKNLLFNVSQYYDYVIIDCPAGIEYGFDVATSYVDEAIVVCTPEMPSIRGASQVVEILKKRKIAPISALVNKVDPVLMKNGLSASFEEIENLLGVPILGKIAFDKIVLICAHNGKPLVQWKSKSNSRDDFKKYVQEYCLNSLNLID